MEIVLALIFAAIVMLGLRRPASVPARSSAASRGSRVTTLVRMPDSRTVGVLTRQELSWLDRFMQPFAGKQENRREEVLAPVRRRLTYAGFRRETSVMTYMGSRVVFAALLPMLVLLTPAAWNFQQLQLAAALCAACGIGLIAPSYWLDQKVKARQKALRLALPDALDLMVVCVEAGLGINASLKRVAEDFRLTHPIMSSEFELANFETRAGKSTTDALRALADRTGVAEVSSLVAMLIQTERFGTGLADTLRVHADGMRSAPAPERRGAGEQGPAQDAVPDRVHLRRHDHDHRRAWLPPDEAVLRQGERIESEATAPFRSENQGGMGDVPTTCGIGRARRAAVFGLRDARVWQY
jgi:tight adherence protein C